MDQLDRSKLISCPHCKVTVLPEADGTCPSCQRRIAKGTVPAKESEREIEEIENLENDEEQEEEFEPEEDVEEPEGVAEKEELSEDESWLASEPDYTTYLLAAKLIMRHFWGLILPSWILAAAILGFFVYVGFKNGFSGAIVNAAISFAVGIGMTALLTIFAFAQGNRSIEIEVTRSLLELPGFDVFFELYRPHLSNRFWIEQNEKKNDFFLSITQKH